MSAKFGFVMVSAFLAGIFWFAGTANSQVLGDTDYICKTNQGAFYPSATPCNYDDQYNNYFDNHNFDRGSPGYSYGGRHSDFDVGRDLDRGRDYDREVALERQTNSYGERDFDVSTGSLDSAFGGGGPGIYGPYSYWDLYGWYGYGCSTCRISATPCCAARPTCTSGCSLR